MIILPLQVAIDIFDPLASVCEFVLTLLKDPSLETHPGTLTLVKDASNIITALS